MRLSQKTVFNTLTAGIAALIVTGVGSKILYGTPSTYEIPEQGTVVRTPGQPDRHLSSGPKDKSFTLFEGCAAKTIKGAAREFFSVSDADVQYKRFVYQTAASAQAPEDAGTVSVTLDDYGQLNMMVAYTGHEGKNRFCTVEGDIRGRKVEFSYGAKPCGNLEIENAMVSRLETLDYCVTGNTRTFVLAPGK